MGKVMRRVTALFAFALLAIGLVPAFAFAEGTDANALNVPETKQYVEVIVANWTYPTTSGAVWDGRLLDEYVEIDETSTVASAIEDALESNDYTQTGAEAGYITEVNGLKAYDGGAESGWMFTLNDWFTNEGMSAYTVAAGTLHEGDVICLQYTCSWGTDIGSDWPNSITTLANIDGYEASISPTFSSNVYEYDLNIAYDATQALITPVATNKNFQARVYKGTQEDGVEIGYRQAFDVEDGDIITVVCGDPSWPSMNTSDGGHTYTLHVKRAETPLKTMFVDLVDGAWYMQTATGAFAQEPNELYLSYVVRTKLMSGYSGTKLFGPEMSMTRAELATVLFRYACPSEAYQTKYEESYAQENATGLSDVEVNKYYTAAVNWAFESGIMTGYKDESGKAVAFGTSASITREELCTIIARFDEYLGGDDVAADDISFIDGDKISSWAVDGVEFCVANGVVNGYTDAEGVPTGYFGPQDTATRTQVAKIIAIYVRDVA